MASGAPERMGAMTDSSRTCEGRVANVEFHVTCMSIISRSFPTSFDNSRMEDDLVLNLATGDLSPSSTKASRVSRGGKWTDR